MNREKKTTLVLTVNGRADFIVRDAASDRRPSTRNGVVARVVVPFLGLILATLICPAPVLAVAFSANGSMWHDFPGYAPVPPGTSSVSPTGATFTQQYVAGAINLNSHAEASSGNLSLLAKASINNMANWDSGHVSSTASARIVEPVDPFWELWASYGATFIFQYELGVSGNLFTTSAGYGAAGSQADLGYTYHVGDSSGRGGWYQDSAGLVSKNGTWGLISSTFTVHKYSTFDLELVATAAAFGSKTYSAGGGNATVVGNADFSHTMTWLGITGVRAFDSSGNEVPLPSGAYLPLIGQDSGFNYWYSAAEPASVPEPATGLLVASGLGVLGMMRKSVVRRRDS